MKKNSVWLACLALIVVAAPAWAIPPFSDAFKAANPNLADKIAEVKCNVCHGKNAEGKDDKKVKNDYGKAVGKFLKKGDFTGDSKKYDPKSDEGMKALKEGLDKAGAEKSPSGKTFAEIIKAGELPAK